MKKIVLLFISLFYLSCSVTNYQTISNTSTGLNFKEGKWLMNYIDTTFENDDEFNTWVTTDFKELLADRLFFIQKIKNNEILKNISIAPSLKDLEYLKKNSGGFDYFINIEAKKSTTNENSTDYQNNTIKNSSKTFYNVWVTIEVYDLKNAVVLYSKTVRAQNTSNSDRYSVHLNSTDRGLLKTCYTKIMKNLKETSIY